MADNPTPPSNDPPTETNPLQNRTLWFLVFAVLFFFVILNAGGLGLGAKTIDYSEFKGHVRSGEVESVIVMPTEIHATPTEDALEAAKEDGAENAGFVRWRTERLQGEDPGLFAMLDEHEVRYSVNNGCNDGLSPFLLLALPLILLMFLGWNILLRRMGAGGGPGSPAMDFGKSRAKLYMDEGTGLTFDDVAGADEAKAELEEVVDFLREPEKISRLGGQVPKGVLLVGPPGTGKTMLAKAVAGEAKVPFFNLSGSDFVEMFVGVGAARVRDLFKQAQEHAPCIIFVDELDAIGKSRASSQLQSNDEREQTLNALLVEMDGFDTRSGVILLAATNRPEILDQALLRPGRFDRQVLVDRPDVVGREAILNTHAKKIIMAEGVDIQVIAQQTPGFVGADLANVVNEAALLAARNGKDAVETSDFQEAIERVIAGLEKKSRRLNEKEKNIVAYHESGHAIVAAAVDTGDPVHKISIVSRGMAALGYTLQLPVEDRYLMTRSELRDRICVLLGGRAAEDIIFGDISTGASNDLERITGMARAMVIEYGMSDTLGNVNYTRRDQSFLGSGLSQRAHSEETAVIVDKEVHMLISELYERTVAILERNIDLLKEMSERIKDTEVLEGEELESFLNLVKPLDATTKPAPSRDGSLP